MIAIEGQFYFQVSAGGVKDFIDVKNLRLFDVVESAGAILPMFKLVFLTSDDSIVAKLHEGQPLNVQFGKSSDSFEDMVLCCNKVHASRSGASRHEVTISGFLGKNNFLSQPKMQITGEMSGVAAVKSVVSKHFNYPATNLQTSQDSQNWVQYNTSDRNFVFDTLMHAYQKNSIIAFAICSNGDFRVRDVKADIAKKAKKVDWLISNSAKKEEAIRHNHYQVQSSHGYMNSLGTYGYEINSFTPETGTDESVVQKPEVIMAMAKSVSKNAEVERRYFGTQMQNKNVHDNFWRAFQQNTVGLLSLSTVKLMIPLAESYRAIKPLDVIMFKDIALEDDRTSNELYSGIYVVSQVRRTIAESKCTVVIEICRESLNGVKNAN
jgi:3-dehydroquinate dehydratase